MIQFNLLPDIKIQYIKSKRVKRMVIVCAGLAIIVSVALLIVMFSVSLFQKHHISDLDKDIKTHEKSLTNTKDLAKILTIQNQLDTLPQLYNQRPASSRLFNYIQATTPTDVSITKISLDFSLNALNVETSANTLESINRYVDTIKFTTFTATIEGGETSSTATKAFNTVVLDKLTRDEKIASGTVKFNFDPSLFDSTKTITFNVPKTITTRSETELPGKASVFDAKGTN